MEGLDSENIQTLTCNILHSMYDCLVLLKYKKLVITSLTFFNKLKHEIGSYTKLLNKAITFPEQSV